MGGNEGEFGRETGLSTHSPFSTHSHTSVDNVLAHALAVGEEQLQSSSPRRISTSLVQTPLPTSTDTATTSSTTSTHKQQTTPNSTSRDPSKVPALCFQCANCNLCTTTPSIALQQIGGGSGGGMHEISPTADEIKRARKNLAYSNIDPRTVPSLHHLQTGSGRVQKKSKLSAKRRKRPAGKAKTSKGSKKPVKKAKKQPARKKPSSHKRKK